MQFNKNYGIITIMKNKLYVILGSSGVGKTLFSKTIIARIHQEDCIENWDEEKYQKGGYEEASQYWGIGKYTNHELSFWNQIYNKELRQKQTEYEKRHLYDDTAVSFIPPKFTKRKARAEDTFVSTSESEFDIEYQITPSIGDGKGETAKYSSTQIAKALERGASPVIATQSVELVKILIEKFPDFIQFIGLNSLFKGWGMMLATECKRYGIPYERGDSDLEEKLVAHGVNIDFVKNRFWNQFVLDDYFKNILKADKKFNVIESRLKCSSNVIEDSWDGKIRPLLHTTTDHAHNVFLDKASTAFYAETMTEGQKTIVCETPLIETPKLLSTYRGVLTPKSSPKGITFDSPQCFAMLGTEMFRSL